MTVRALKETPYGDAAKPARPAYPQKLRDPQPAASAEKTEKVEKGFSAVELRPVNNSDAAVVANYAALVPASGMTFIDFGFLEPLMIAAIQQSVRDGKEPPETVHGKLTARIALNYDTVVSLYNQLGQLIAFQPSGEKT